MIQSFKNLTQNKDITIYNILSYIPVHIIIDVGAAAGATTLLSKKFAPQSIIYSYEPFPGNWPHFIKNCQNLNGVELKKQAVDNKKGVLKFRTAPVIKGNEEKWGHLEGYSSGGKLVSGQKVSGNIIDVEAIRIEEEYDTRISFLKIDVQGTELSVLKSAEKLFSKELIDLVYCEYDGQDSLLQFMLDWNYVIFDTNFLVVPTIEGGREILPKHNVMGETLLSNGRVAYHLDWLEIPRGYIEYEKFVNEVGISTLGCQTDLIFVSRSFYPYFLNGISTLLRCQKV